MNSREKGCRGELEVAQVLREHGYLARRGQQYRGGPGSPDILCPDFPATIEVKRRQRVNLASAIERLRRESEGGLPPLLIHRRDREPWLATMTLKEFLELVGGQPESKETPHE